jgi:hypothetical protein
MKKFVYIYIGSGGESSQDMQAWISWFGSLGSHLVDSGNPFGEARAMTASGSVPLEFSPTSVTGYSIINAEDFAEAESLAAGCPMGTGVQIYEAMPM